MDTLSIRNHRVQNRPNQQNIQKDILPPLGVKVFVVYACDVQPVEVQLDALHLIG